MSDLIEKVEEIARPIVEKHGQEIVELDVVGSTIKILVGSQAGPTVSDLIAITREFNKFVEARKENLSFAEFAVEISSPGLDRPLKTLADFRRNIGRFVNLTIETDGKSKVLETVIVAVDESVEFKAENESFKLDPSLIKKAKLAIKFK